MEGRTAVYIFAVLQESKEIESAQMLAESEMLPYELASPLRRTTMTSMAPDKVAGLIPESVSQVSVSDSKSCILHSSSPVFTVLICLGQVLHLVEWWPLANVYLPCLATCVNERTRNR
jgi:hypothetical protein